ncbi:hypothetical protein M9H77_14003 [Catharanthus roseus]|uniref:Uncharacterized protein n=1 Tax=Catharanthus roseus TaxID=4058 RepID=A0ACC0BLT9_CATRO|nr:hypothetical protein M9H77_14003 [Catharanthus roseus]
MKTSFRPGLKFVENQVNERVSGLHCTWLVPRTRASSDDVDGFLTLRVDPPKEERSTWRAWPNRYLRRHRIMLCGGTVAYFRRGILFSTERHMLLERTVEVQGDNNCFDHLRDRV